MVNPSRPAHNESSVSTIRDVAHKAGVALSTASYVLNHKNRSISVATQERIWSAAKELGYQPNWAARALVTRRTNMIALWISNVSSPFSAHIVAEVQRMVRAIGFDLIISEISPLSEGSTDRQTDARSYVDGTIAYLGPECRNLPLRKLIPKSAPVVSIGSVAIPDTDFIEIDLFSGSQDAVRYISKTSRTRIAYLVPESNLFVGDYRYDAYLATMAELSRKPELIMTPENSRCSARRTILEYVQREGAPDGIFCYNDILAIGAYRGLRDQGIAVPEQTLLAGCDGIEDIEYLDRPFGTIVLPIGTICTLAWEMLEQRMKKSALAPRKQTLRPAFQEAHFDISSTLSDIRLD